MSEQTESLDIKNMAITKNIELGTEVKTTFMEPFIVELKDGNYRMDIDIILNRIKLTAKFINNIGLENTMVCSSNNFAETPMEKFVEVTGIEQRYGRFMPGTLTNPSLTHYIEPKLILVSDPQKDDQAVTEATNAGIPVVGISNTDNITSKVDLVIPGNNRGRQSFAVIYWLLAREILIQQGKLQENEQLKYSVEDFENKVSDEETD